MGIGARRWVFLSCGDYPGETGEFLDPQTLEIWQAKAADGTIRGYMERTVTRR